MRWRVDTRCGYASFDESEEARARELYEDCGIRLRRCEDIFDEGVVVEGVPIGVEFERGDKPVN